MSFLTLHDAGGFLYLDEAECRAAGAALAIDYRMASPFPHIVIDDFIDHDVLRRVSAAFPDREGKRFYNRDQEHLKYEYKPGETSNGLVRNILAELNSEAFLRFLSALSGIEGLIADPYFHGGGLHETCAGGHLGIHADFNIHENMKVERRLNLLVYLNEDWDPAFGGDLELWDSDMVARRISVAPLIGRAVIFNTTLDSFHGHPDPLTCPPDRTRRSIATYYYSAITASETPPVRTTNFRQRPHKGDHRDWQIAYQHWVNDWVPARLQPFAREIGPH